MKHRLIELTEAIAVILERDGGNEMAEELRGKARVTPMDAEHLDDLNWIIELCDAPRGLSDIFVSGLSQDEWYRKIGDLRDEAARLRGW